MPLPRRLADTIVALLTLIRRHQRIHDFCLRTAVALKKLPGGASLVRTIQETQRPRVPPYKGWTARVDTPEGSFPVMTSSRQEIILHIGHGKTGSSFIQSSLALSVALLRNAGIEYPEIVSLKGAARGNISSGNLAADKAFVQTVTDVARRHPKAERLLFSSEFLFVYIHGDNETLARLQRDFDVTVVLFIREFLACKISNYNQGVKRHGYTNPLGPFLAEDQSPKAVLSVLQAVERAGCRLEVFNYSRHSEHLLATFAGAIGVAPETLAQPPVARVNRSLDEAELALARRFNAALGESSGVLLADVLCQHLPLHPSGIPRVNRKDYDAFRARVAPFEAAINPLLPPSERYGTDEPILIENGDEGQGRVMGFTEAQIDVIAQSLGGEIASLKASKAELFDLQRWVVERSPLFDAEWYLLTYPDVKASGLDPIVHYLMFGARELRNPSVNFDTAAYLQQNPDVETKGFNPLYHFIRYGDKK